MIEAFLVKKSQPSDTAKLESYLLTLPPPSGVASSKVPTDRSEKAEIDKKISYSAPPDLHPFEDMCSIKAATA